MTTFLLVRHASHGLLGKRLAGRMPGVHLNHIGREQAQALGRKLQSKRVAAVYSSPMERCQETAIPIASALNLPIRLHSGFNELDFARWTGASFQELDPEREWQQWNSARATARCPGGESMAEAQERIISGLRVLCTAEPDRNVVIVSHCDMIKAAVMHFLGLSLDRILSFEIGAASISSVRIDAWSSTVISVNERLEEL
jgi:broad specificity phosphatase PhoE